MTITLTRDEITTFQDKLAEWYRRQMIYVFENYRQNDERMMVKSFKDGDIVKQLMLKFEVENPKPDWRTFL